MAISVSSPLQDWLRRNIYQSGQASNYGAPKWSREQCDAWWNEKCYTLTRRQWDNIFWKWNYIVKPMFARMTKIVCRVF